RVGVVPSFRPFRAVGPPEVATTRSGRIELRRYSFRLECLTRSCVPRASERPLVPGRAIVRVAGAPPLVVPLPAVTIASRLSARDLATAQLRAPPPVPAGLSPAIDPRALAAVLSGAAVLAVLVASALVLRLLRPAETSGALAPVLRDLQLDALGARAGVLAWSEREPDPISMRDLVAAVRAERSEAA